MVIMISILFKSKKTIIISMPLMNEIGLKQEILKVQQQNEELKQETKKNYDGIATIQTEFRIALGKVLENQELTKPIQDRILEFTQTSFHFT